MKPAIPCAICQNFTHCTKAGYCNCGAYGVRDVKQAHARDEVPYLEITREIVKELTDEH